MFELAGYETLDLIGGGGFGEVWLAAQNSTGRNVAVKVAHAPILDETLQIRFEREYKALGRLSGHPNIVDIVTAGTLPDGRAFLVLEFIEGGTLWDRSQRERIEEDDLIDIGIELAKALKTAHNAGVLHRDVKPENVLLRDTDEAVLSDFGLAHLTDGATTSPNAVVASVAYAAPEILRGEGASTSTDLYGLGVCLLTAAIRSVPFVELHDKSIQTVIQRVLSDPPQDISELGYSDLFNNLVADLMAKDADSRPVTADEALQRLEELPQLRGDQDFSWSDLLGAPETAIEAANSVTAQIEAIQVDESDDATTNDLWWAAPTTSSEVDVSQTDSDDSNPDQDRLASAEADVETPDLQEETRSSATVLEKDKDETEADAEEPDLATSEDSPAENSVAKNTSPEDGDQVTDDEDLDDIDKLIFELTTSEQIRQDDIKAAQRSEVVDESSIDEVNVEVSEVEQLPELPKAKTPRTPVIGPEPDNSEDDKPTSGPSPDSLENKPSDSEIANDATSEPSTSSDSQTLTDGSDGDKDASSFLATVPVRSFLSDSLRKPDTDDPSVANSTSGDSTTDTTNEADDPQIDDPATQEPASVEDDQTDDPATQEPTSADDNQTSDGDVPDSTMEMPAITIGQPGLPTPNPLITSLEAKPSGSVRRVNPAHKGSAVNAGVQHEALTGEPNFLDRTIDVDKPDDNEQAKKADDNEQAEKADDNEVDDIDFAPAPLADPIEPTSEDDQTNPFKRLLVGFAILAVLSVLTGLILRVALSSDSGDGQTSQQPSGDAVALVLPLSIGDEGLASGTIEATTPSLGPSTALFCQNALDASGMTTWKGSQFFPPDNTGSIEQLVVGFANDQSADSYVSAIEDSLDCETWNQTLSGRGYAIVAEPNDPSTSFGDRSADFDVTASSTDGSEILGRTFVIRSGSNVAVIGVKADDQDSFEELTTVAEQAGTSFSKGVDG